MDKQAADILRKAKALIDKPEKWLKCNFNVEDRYCVEGAMMHVAAFDYRNGRLADAASNFFRLAVKGSPLLWNDRDETTHSDVMLAFDRAITLADPLQRISDSQYTKRFIESLSTVSPQEVTTAK